MFSPLRNRFGIPGVISVIALVFAMLGGAYAANDSGSGDATASAKRKSKAGKRGPRGPRGKRGPAGPAGPAGLPGPAGPQGPAGANGNDGTNGQNGTNGKSVTVTEIPTEVLACEERGGAEVKQEGAGSGVKVCTGEEGSPWTAGGTLPAGETLTGAWAFGMTTAEGEVHVPISFPLPLSGTLGVSQVHFINKAGKEQILNETTFEEEEVTSTKCLGTAQLPSAVPGHLCIYTGTEESFVAVSNFSITKPGLVIGTSGRGADVSGASFNPFATAAGARGIGTWAVTAE